MIFELHRPGGILSRYVESIVFYEGYSAPHRADKLLPDGGIYWIVNMLEKPGRLYRDENLKKFKEFSGNFISGQHKHFIFIGAEHASNMAIKFKLGGAAPFFNFPISELNNKVMQLEPILGRKAELVRQGIISEKNVTKKFEQIENYLLSILRRDYVYDDRFASALRFLEEEPQKAGTAQLAKDMGVSQKHLISLFGNQVGLTPKTLVRIFRFQNVIKALEKKQKIDWMQVVADCGYYDQSHFVKDFYNFSGIRPSLYSQQKGDYINFIPHN